MLLIVIALLIFFSTSVQAVPHPDHIVIVIEENRSFEQIIGSQAAPYVNELAKRGILFTQSYGVSHPSLPNYLALFAGTTGGLHNNACPLELSGHNLAEILQNKGLSFVSYAESMPQPGFEGCYAGAYMRKHNPVAYWKELASLNQTFNAFPRADDFAKLPAVSWVIPNQLNDMHDGSIGQGDRWLADNLESYAHWAMTHNSLLIVTWDEDDGSANNHVATIFVGAMVKQGSSAQRIDHYSILRTLEELMGLEYLGESAEAESIIDVWREAAQRNYQTRPFQK